VNRYKQHQIELKKIKLAFQERFPNGRIFDQHVGTFFTVLGSRIKVGYKGMSDLWALVDGRYIAIEVKTGKARQSKKQKEWEAKVHKLGGEYYVIRSPEEVSIIPKYLQQQHLETCPSSEK
jgi:hypothetical protein